jgi:two-component system chemotaxis sensor kinase CheA
MDELAHYAHAVESMLDQVRNGGLTLSSLHVSLLLKALDCIKGFVAEALGEGALDRGVVSESHRGILAAMGGAPAMAKPVSVTPVAGISAVGSSSLDGALPEPAREDRCYIIQVSTRPDFIPRPSELTAVSSSLEQLGGLVVISHEHSLPPEDQRRSDVHYLWRSFYLTTTADEATVGVVLTDWSAVHRVSIDHISGLPESPINQAEVDAAIDGVSEDFIGRSGAQPSTDSAGAPHSELAEPIPPLIGATSIRPGVQTVQKLSSIRVDTGKLDKLVNLVGGLITVEARLQSFEDTVETREPDLAEELLGILDDSSRILRELQDQAMSVRMVPIGGAFDALHRLVRDYCRETGKRAGLTVSGQDTEVDKKVSEQISAPLKHIVRNALDHGIESPAERVAQGKAPEGQITLSAYHQYGLIVIQVQDDGRGINVDAVTQSARRRGIIDGSRDLSQRDALELIFAPSLSTAAVVTEVSGRGVGMDVVKRDIEALRGKIDVATEPGGGTTITLSIPQTLSIVECLVVGIGPNRYSIPLSSVEECVELAPRSDPANGGDVLDLRGDLVPFLRLRELFDVSGTTPLHEKIVIVSTGQWRAGLVVDRLIGNHQAVIKPMSPLHRDVRSFLGATILGDGQVVLVLDVIQLIDFGQSRQERLRAS